MKVLLLLCPIYVRSYIKRIFVMMTLRYKKQVVYLTGDSSFALSLSSLQNNALTTTQVLQSIVVNSRIFPVVRLIVQARTTNTSDVK